MKLFDERNNATMYAGSGACELCGETEPCNLCNTCNRGSTWTYSISKEGSKKIDNDFSLIDEEVYPGIKKFFNQIQKTLKE